MKAMHIMAILYLFILPLYAKSEDALAVNAVLPKDQQIWPLPRPNASVVVEATWKGGREVMRIRKGDWFRIWRFCEYTVEKIRTGQFPDRNISFIMEDTWPTPESGIVEKRLDCPFAEGTKAIFYLNPSRDAKVSEVQSYEIWSDVGYHKFHRKPE